MTTRLASERDEYEYSGTKAPRAGEKWTPATWRKLPVKQQPYYKDEEAYEQVITKLNALPPLVQVDEIVDLRRQLVEVSERKRFILQGGDCAERFQDCTAGRVENKVKLLMQMGVVLGWGARIPITRIGRIAGQYHKPRSKATEMIKGREIFVYKGDAINGIDHEDREHDPKRLEEGYYHAAATLNYIRGLLRTEFTDISCPRTWDLEFVTDKDARAKYDAVVHEIADALEFRHAYSKKGAKTESEALASDLFTSHEGLVLGYEEAMTRPRGGKFYNTGAHFVWIGDRTRQLDGAHIEYFRGIENPIGIKCGPTTVPIELVELIKTVNPRNEKGKIVLISRFGAGKVAAHLPQIIKAVVDAGLEVVWQCDPMHGNTFSTESGVKTRNYAHILSEVEECFAAHKAAGTWLGGVHFEMSAEDVTECVGGSCNLQPHHLSENYESFCDPRLNWQQSIEIAFSLVETLKKYTA